MNKTELKVKLAEAMFVKDDGYKVVSKDAKGRINFHNPYSPDYELAERVLNFLESQGVNIPGEE